MDKQKSLEGLKLRVFQTEEIKREKLMSDRIDVVTQMKQCQWREKSVEIVAMVSRRRLRVAKD